MTAKEITKNFGYRKWDGLDKQEIDKFNVANIGDGVSTFVKYYDDTILYEGTKKLLEAELDGKLDTMWRTVKTSISENPFGEYTNGYKGAKFERGLLSQKKWF